jgi:hypothetical protein
MYSHWLVAGYLFVLLLTDPKSGSAQNVIADQKMKEIEYFKRFTRKPLAKEYLNGNRSDTSIRVLDLVMFTRKKDGLGKVVQRSRYQGTEIKRTCYLNEGSKLFAIRDSIWYDNHTTRQLNYYFKNGKLESVIDSKNENVTDNINQTELFSWLKSMFDNLEIE